MNSTQSPERTRLLRGIHTLAALARKYPDSNYQRYQRQEVASLINLDKSSRNELTSQSK